MLNNNTTIDVSSRDRKLAVDICAITSELLEREKEALALYEPMPLQEDFHRSTCRVRLIRGSARSGKTLAAAVELARAVLNVDPHKKYPKTGIAYIVGYDYAHHGSTIYPKLFTTKQSMQIIRDLQTKKWRLYRPWVESENILRVSEVIPANPLIPERYIEAISWQNKAEEIPSRVVLKTGWEIYFFSGDGLPPRGQAIDYGWIDEEVRGRDWYAELSSRCMDRDGKIVWSAAPQSNTDQLYELSLLAEAQRGFPDRVVEEFHAKLSDNYNITERQKRELLAMATNDADRIMRIDGEFLMTSSRVFPEFTLQTHGIPFQQIPQDWTRYLIIDPGHTIAAGLFLACPPPSHPEYSGMIVAYDEVYVPKASAETFAQAVAEKMPGQYLEDIIIDKHGSNPTEAGSGVSIFEQYQAAFRKHNIRSKNRGSRIVQSGVGNRIKKKTGNEAIRNQWLRGLSPKFRVLVHRQDSGQLTCHLPNFEFEMSRYRFKMARGSSLFSDEPDERGRVHLMSCLRFAVASNLKHVQRSPGDYAEESPAYSAFVRIRDEARKKMPGALRGLVFGPDRGN